MITDLRARQIANAWYCGGLYRFVSTGVIDEDIRDEIAELRVASQDLDGSKAPDSLAKIITIKERYEILSLCRYIEGHENRGPVEGWQALGQEVY